MRLIVCSVTILTLFIRIVYYVYSNSRVLVYSDYVETNYACVNNYTDRIRMVKEGVTCRYYQKLIEWNNVGPQGEPGNLALAGQNCNESFVTGFENNGNIIYSSGEMPEPPSIEICDCLDNNGDGQIDEDMNYCFDGVPPQNTDGSACLAGFLMIMVIQEMVAKQKN